MMIGWLKRRAGAAGAAAMVLALWLCPAASGAAVEWAGFAGNAQHTADGPDARSAVPPDPLEGDRRSGPEPVWPRCSSTTAPR